MKNSIWYKFIFVMLFLLDRISKYWAYYYLENEIRVTSFLSFDFVINRGVTWGLFGSDNTTIFVLVSFVIFIIVAGLFLYTVNKFRQGYSILGETIVLSGAISNIIDRVLYHGVIDFISLNYMDWYFPVFNLADVFIDLGVLIMIFEYFKNEPK